MKSQLSVVLVDDDEDTRDVFHEFLTIKGFKVLGTGKNGKECFELFKNFCPDVVTSFELIISSEKYFVILFPTAASYGFITR